jgi:hypothetical protein
MIQQSCTSVFIQRIENVHPYKNLHMGVYISFIHICPNLWKIKMSFILFRPKEKWGIKS